MNPTTILIVDDSETDRFTYRRYLSDDRSKTYRILEAKTLEEGLDLCAKDKPNAILLNFQLPDGSGLDFLNRLNQSGYSSQLPVIMIIGQGNEHIALEAIKSGAQEYLVVDNFSAERLQLTLDILMQRMDLISDRQQAEQLIRQQSAREFLLREITQRIRQSLDLQTIFETAVEEIRQFLHADRVGIFQFDPDSNFNDGELVAESVVAGFDSAMAVKIHDHCFGEQYAPYYQQGRIQAVDDIYNAGLLECHINVLAQFQIRANLIVPLLNGATLWGLLCIHQCSAPRSWQSVEIDLIKQIASQLAIAIQQASLYQMVQNELAENNKLFLQLSSELKQKKVLLKEIHHRVKNNLQVMSSILYLQFRKASPEVKALSEDYQNRIQSMALIHDQLYRSDDLANIDFRQYITNLTSNLFQCYGINPALIRLKLEVNNISIHLDQSIPLGLIINELVSNALKHAFPEHQGEITIKLIQSEQQFSLTVADNGVGIPPDFNPKNTNGLGMHLVKSLTEQLEGELIYDGKKGSLFQITFPILKV